MTKKLIPVIPMIPAIHIIHGKKHRVNSKPNGYPKNCL